ncbi:YcxB family protein [Massilia sp. P8910]|uniref:YcxB family protein n=1 Tax=Massilia antarctica TaxID=2765360 RepID=UPI001E547BBC|nr:YcxB family protein [Massilia antarctica]MCE3606289.1 YcxB family protein [Massilia antarctica]
MMQVTVDITKRDVFLVSLAMIPRLKGNWIFMGVLALAIFVLVLVTRTPDTLYSLGVAAVAALGGALGGGLSALTINVATMLLKLDAGNPMLGRHHYALTDTGLELRAGSQDSMLPWASIASVRRLSGYIVFRLNGNGVFLLPRRAFSSGEAFQAFSREACALKGA